MVFAMSGLLAVFLAPLCQTLSAEGPSSSLPGEHTAILTDSEKAWIASHPVIHIQMSDCSPPFEFRENGVWKGMAYEYLHEACRHLGLQVEVTTLSWTEALENIQGKRDVDLLLAVTSSPERARQMLLTEDYLAFPQVIFTTKQHAFIADLNDLAASTVVVEREYVMEGWLKRDLPKARIVVVADTAAALKQVSTGQADAYVGNLAVGSYLVDTLGLVNIKVAAPADYGDEKYAMGVRTDWPQLVQLLNKALASIPAEKKLGIRHKWMTVGYEFGLRPTDVLKWVLAVVVLALAFIVPLRVMVKRRTAELSSALTELKASEEKFRELADLLPQIIFETDAQGRITYTNRQAFETFKETREAIERGVSALDYIAPCDRERAGKNIALRLAGGAPQDPSYTAIRRNGTTLPILLYSAPIKRGDAVVGLRGIMVDITERKRMEASLRENEERLRQAEKMNAIGQLAGGVAHDFNNQLTSIMGFAELLEQRLDDERLRTYARNVLVSAHRSADLTQQLLAFSRQGKFRSIPVNVHSAITETATLLERSIDKRVHLRMNLNADPHTVLGDPTQLQNAILNLALNARDAMPNGGELAIETKVVDQDEAYCRRQPDEIVPGRYLQLTVMDNGAGMDRETLKRVFEPFFTTKEPGKGTGLGLASVYGTVKNHKGAIHLHSEPGRGTTVQVYLPLVSSAGSTTDAGEAVPSRARSVRIMVVDDEEMVRTLLVDSLTARGHQVVACKDGAEAIERYTHAHGEIDLVILDMVMPKMGGHELFRALRRINPGVKALLSSGFSLTGQAQAILDEGVQGFIQKPFSKADLDTAIADALGHSTTPT
jgi:PAS domain S-box-containing protein